MSWNGGRREWIFDSLTRADQGSSPSDGSYLSNLDGLPVRIVEADLTMSGADGSRIRDTYRLITALTDHARSPGGRSTSRTSQPPTRRQRIRAIMSADPHRTWSGKELAERLQVKPRHLLTRLAGWTRLGFLTRTGAGTYALDTPP